MSQKRRNYSPEYRAEAVKRVIQTSRPVVQVARELGILEGTLGNWVATYRREHAGVQQILHAANGSRVPIRARNKAGSRAVAGR